MKTAFSNSVRIQKIIADSGLCSRRKAELLIEEGRVKVNRRTAKLGDKADPLKDTILVDGKPIRQQKKLYLAFYKPIYVETTMAQNSTHGRGRRTIAHYVSKLKIKERVYAVGRLDYDTEGLLLLTNDGYFANKVMHPRYEIEKTYEGLLDRPLSEKDRKTLEQGVTIQGRKTWPAKVTIRGPRRKGFIITIHEGRNRIVRRMFKALGYNVEKLKRTKIGPVSLGKLRPGHYRKLSTAEINALGAKRKETTRTN